MARAVTKTKKWNPQVPDKGTPLLLVFGQSNEIAKLDYTTPPLDLPHGRAWTGFGLVVIAAIEVSQHGRLLHVSISHGSGKLVPWEIVASVKRALFPSDVAAMMPLPEEQNYVNIAEVLHIVQLPCQWGNEI